MDFAYNFSAVRGRQANKEYYIAMVPLKLISRLFTSEDQVVPPEFRAQRKINENRIPEIKTYILDNRDSYVFSALSASIDGDFSFVPYEHSNIGTLKISMDACFLINDGQHRKAAIEAAMKEDETLGDETISVVFFKDEGLARSQQMFTDLNKHAVKTSNSLATLYDSRDSVAVATRAVIEAVPFFKRYTDKERDILGKNSSNLFTLNNIYRANLKILHADTCQEADTDFLIRFWTCVSDNITEWQELLRREITKRDLRENYIITLAVTLNAIGRMGRFFYDNQDTDFQTYLPKLQGIDWLRSNAKDWQNRTIRPNGKVMNSEEAVALTCARIKALIGISLTKDENAKERTLKKYKPKEV